MNKTLITALQYGRRKAHLTQEEVANLLKIKKNTISNYENGISEPDIDTFCELCKIYKIDVSKLFGEICGIRLFYNDFVMKPSEIDYLLKYRNLDENGKIHIEYEINREIESLNLLKEKESEIEKTRHSVQEFINIPYFQELSFNEPNEYVFSGLPTNTLSALSTDISLQADFIMDIHTKSMIPTFKPDDLVYIKQTTDLNMNDIGLFLNIENNANKKKHSFFGEFQGDTVVRHNKKYPSIYVSDSIRIIGKVIGIVE